MSKHLHNKDAAHESHESHTHEAPATVAQPEATVDTPAAKPVKDSRFVKVVVPENRDWVSGPDSNIAPGAMNRKDFIMSRVEEGASRGQITKEIRNITGDNDFKYQIVFQATSDLPAEKYPHLRGGHPNKGAKKEASEASTEAVPAE